MSDGKTSRGVGAEDLPGTVDLPGLRLGIVGLVGLVGLLAMPGCFRSVSDDCSGDGDCYAGEQCVSGTCEQVTNDGGGGDDTDSRDTTVDPDGGGGWYGRCVEENDPDPTCEDAMAMCRTNEKTRTECCTKCRNVLETECSTEVCNCICGT